MFKNIKDVTEMTNALKKAGKPLILLVGFLGFCHTLTNLNDTPSNDNAELETTDSSDSSLSEA